LTRVYREKKIDELKGDDKEVRVIGRVESIDKDTGTIILKGKEKTVLVTFDENFKKDVKEGDIIRVFGEVSEFEGKVEISGFIVQNMNELDLELKERVEKIRRR